MKFSGQQYLATATHAYRRRLPLLEPHRRLRPPLVRPSPRELIVHPPSAISPGSTAWCTNSLTALLGIRTRYPNECHNFFGNRIYAPQRMAVQGTHQRLVPSSSLQRAPRYRFVAWRFRSSGYTAHRWTAQEERKSLEYCHCLTVFFPFTTYTYTPAGKCFHSPRTRLPCSV